MFIRFIWFIEKGREKPWMEVSQMIFLRGERGEREALDRGESNNNFEASTSPG